MRSTVAVAAVEGHLLVIVATAVAVAKSKTGGWGDVAAAAVDVAAEVVGRNLFVRCSKCWSRSRLMIRRHDSWLSGRRIVAKALDGQRYPLPLCEYMWVYDGERGSDPERADDLCSVSF